MEQPRYWIGVASKDHVLHGVQGSFCQLCHGKNNPLKRLSAGDWIVYYSPRTEMNSGNIVQSFTAIGQILDRDPYLVQMDDGFTPYRRDVRFIDVQEISIRLLLADLSFIKNKQSWGYVFRFGLFEIPKSDFQIIAAAMKAEVLVNS
jgi:predicted RNA-binding protein